MDGWMDESINGYIGLIDGWMDGRMTELIVG